jgi:hypothetical protein
MKNGATGQDQPSDYTLSEGLDWREGSTVAVAQLEINFSCGSWLGVEGSRTVHIFDLEVP